MGNEYGLYTRLVLPTSQRINVVNVYLPPTSSLLRRDIAESRPSLTWTWFWSNCSRSTPPLCAAISTLGSVHVSPFWTTTTLPVLLLIPTYVLVLPGSYKCVNCSTCIY
jgi:hypothetical protein